MIYLHHHLLLCEKGEIAEKTIAICFVNPAEDFA